MPDWLGPNLSISRRIAVTLSLGVNVARGPPMSVLTHPGLMTTQVIRCGARSIAAFRITMFTAALELRYAIDPPDVLSPREPMPLVMVIASLRWLEESFDYPQWTHCIDIEDLGPRIIVYFTDFLPGGAGNPRTIDNQVDRNIADLCSCGTDAFQRPSVAA
jgi:hypothetical protein